MYTTREFARVSTFVSGSRARPGALDQNFSNASRSYVFPLHGTNTGSRNIARVIGHSKCAGSSGGSSVDIARAER